MGFPTEVKWVWAAMNPMSYSATQALDEALIGRFAIFLYPPDVLQMSEEDRIQVTSHINGEPQERQNLSVSGFSGFKCSWEFMGKKHLGLFLEEKIGGGMGVIHFVDCQAPSSDFDQYKGDFEKIVAYIKR